MKVPHLFFVVAIILVLLLVPFSISVEPSGASVNVISSETTPTGSASTVESIAGNITLVDVFSGSSVTQSWQGYYGNVSGGMRLADAANNPLYNWSVASPSGEIYASTNNTITWVNVQCFNFTATGTYTNENGNGGTTSQYGTNMSIIASEFGFSLNDVDSINNTFSTKNHDEFYTANMHFSADECQSVQLFTDSSQSEDGKFEEVLLYEPDTRSIIFTTILEVASKGFDGTDVDFEMLVLENGHGADISTTTYYFFLEIE